MRVRLSAQWQRVYAAAASHTPNIIHVEYGTFDYICDSYSGMEALGEVAFDQRVRDRVVGVLGISLPMRGRRRGSLPKDWVEHPGEIDKGRRDKGRFIAHAISGGLDMNVFSQARGLNRGISEQGKVYRLMERYCYDNAGTFCFSRPIYDDATSIPRWVEFGLPHALRIFADVTLKKFDVVLPAAGATNAAIRISPDRLAELVQATWVDVAQDQS
jgi:hypothetical protein